MIVVAIIGILSAVAIPNFQRFQLKSRQSEAKTNLAAIYQVQKTFRQEWSQYFADWNDLGFAPEGTMKYDFSTSQTAAQIAPSVMAGYMGPSGPGGAPTEYFSTTYCNGGGGNNICFLDTDYNLGSVRADSAALALALNIDKFTAAAVSNLVRDTALPNDQWSMTQDKNLTNDQIGF